MRVVVADTSPLHYLVLTNTIDLLPRLFQQVIAPDVVRAELLAEETPALVRAWSPSKRKTCGLRKQPRLSPVWSSKYVTPH